MHKGATKETNKLHVGIAHTTGKIAVSHICYEPTPHHSCHRDCHDESESVLSGDTLCFADDDGMQVTENVIEH